jgi:cell wall-associated NlpC family hydrolase
VWFAVLRKSLGFGRHRASRRTLTVALSLILSSLAPALAGAPAHADPGDTIASKAAEAKRLEAAIEANGARISELDEEYNETRLRIAQANEGLADAEARIDQAKRESNGLRRELDGRAAALYTQAGTSTPLADLDLTSVRDLGARSKYSDAAAERDDDLIADLAAARELLDERQGELEKARGAAEAQQAALEDQRASVEAATAEQEDLLSQVQGELKQLVEKERERRQAAAEAAARAEFEARVAREQAARTNTSSGGSSSNAPSVAPPNVPAPSSRAQVAVDTATAQVGDPYVYAAAGPDSFDCSGLTMYAWAAAGVSLPHSSRAQYAALPHVPMESLAPGDLVFYGSPIHHVGMYLGNGQYVHAPQTGDVVKISSVYRSDFAGAARPG